MKPLLFIAPPTSQVFIMLPSLHGPTLSRSLQLAPYLLAGVLLLLTGCSSSQFLFEPLSPEPVTSEPIVVHAADSSVQFEGSVLTFSGTVTDVMIDGDAQLLLVRHEAGGSSSQQRLVAYDLASDQARWSSASNATVSVLADSIAVLRHGAVEHVLDAATGTVLRPAEPRLFFLQDGPVLSLAKDRFARLDPYTGATLWERPGASWTGYREEVIADGWLYLVADGLHAFDLDTGDGWFHPISTSHTQHGKEIAKEIGLTVLGALVGTLPTGSYDPDVQHNLNARPVPHGSRVFFAARDKVFAFDQVSGEQIWETALGEAPGRMMVIPASDTTVALLGLGWTWVDRELKKARPPTLTLLDAATGEVHHQHTLNTTDAILAAQAMSEGYAVLTGRTLYRLDPNLEVVGIVETRAPYGDFVSLEPSFGEADGVLAVRTRGGLLGLDPVSLEPAWFTELGTMPHVATLERDPWVRPLRLHAAQASLRYETAGRLWLAGGSSLTGLDTSCPTDPMATISWPTGGRLTVAEGHALRIEDNQVTVIALTPAPSR